MPADGAFAESWSQLRDLSDRIFRRGFDRSRRAILAEHEIRSLAYHPLEEAGKYVVVAGDKLGCWYAASICVEDPEETTSDFKKLPFAAGNDRVIDDLLIVEAQTSSPPSVVLGTRGNGAWTVSMEYVLAGLRGENDTGHQLTLLPGARDRTLDQLIWDGGSRTLLGVARYGDHNEQNELLTWTSTSAGWSLASAEEFPYPLTALAMDRGDEANQADQMYVATGRFELHRFERPGKDAAFDVTAERIGSCEPVWEGRLSPILRMRPLSDVGAYEQNTSIWQKAYPHRGVVAMSLRHLLLIHDRPEEPGEIRCHARLVVGESKNLTLGILNLPDRSRDKAADWHAIAVSTLEGTVRIFRPSGLRRPESDGFATFLREAPENKWPISLISGYEELDADVLSDRIYALQPLLPLDGEHRELPVVFGLGNNEVCWHRLRLRWRLRREARSLAARLVKQAPSIEWLLKRLQHIALGSFYWQEADAEGYYQEMDPQGDKHSLIQVIPRLWRRFETGAHWHAFNLLVWDILARRTPRYVAVEMIQALRRVQHKLPEALSGDDLLRRQAEVEEEIRRIRKFVLDPGHFSKKQTRFLELSRACDPALADERAIYRSILLARRHDPLFVADFDQLEGSLLGEVLAFVPLPSSGGSRPFWDVETPAQLRFLATNYLGELWLLDGTGNHCCLIKEPRGDLGHIPTMHVHDEDLLLSFSAGQLRRLPLDRVPPEVPAESTQPELELVGGIGQTQIFATAFASLEPDDDDPAPRLLWGDLRGRIYLSGHPEPLFVHPAQSDALPPDGAAIRQLVWFEAQWHSGSEKLVLAATAAGWLLLFRWCDGVSPELQCTARIQLGNGPISALQVTGPEKQHIVAACYDTAVGVKILGTRDEPRLGAIWAFRTGDTVRSVQPITEEITGEPGTYLMLIGSHDAHLYAIDLEGRHLETYSFRQDPLRRPRQSDDEGFKVGLFVATPRRKPEDDDNVLFRVYACAFENRYIGIRIIDRPKMLRQFNSEELDGCSTDEQEASLTRWRAYHVDEGHLRHRFIRQSRRYIGSDPQRALDAIQWLLEAGDTTYEPTGEMTALLRRLFQSGRAGLKQGPENRDASQRLFVDSRLYERTVILLRECEKRWDTPGSLANRRVQLFWIRSLLRQIHGVEVFRSWLALGKEVAARLPLADPKTLLQHFLEQSHRLVQFKTLQYLERMFFGWPGTDTGKIFRDGEIHKGDLDWLLDALFSRLAARPEQVSRQESSPVVLQIGRLLCLMVRQSYVDPLYLTYLIQLHTIAHDFYRILEDQWEAIAASTESQGAVGNRQDPGQVFRLARRLDQGLADDAPLDEIVDTLEALIDREWPSSSGPDTEYLKQAPRYFKALIPLLKVKALDDLQTLAQKSPSSAKVEILENCKYCPSHPHITSITPLIQAVRTYYVKKYEDQWVPPVMTHLQFEDFDQVRREWREWRAGLDELLDENPPGLARRETRLLERLLAHWEEILITREQNIELLQDFQFAVHEHCFEEIKPSYRFDPEKVEEVRKEKQLAFTAFSNLFTRLLLLAEPREALFLYRLQDESDEIQGVWFQGGEKPLLQSITDETANPPWFPREWLDPASFLQLVEETVKSRLVKEQKKLVWQVISVAGTPDEKGMLAFFIFAWKNKNAEGLRRFSRQRLAWEVPLQALVYRRAAVEQVELKGRVFSIIAHNLGSPVYLMRSDLRVLLDKRLEGQGEKRLEKYRQLLRQAKHMDGIIDSVLSLSDRKIDRQVTTVSVAALTYDVVRTVRREASARRVEIDYAIPADEAIRATRIGTDEPKAYDILLNLLNNAVKYSPVRSRVNVSVMSRLKGVEVRVRDRGPGIPDDERPRIYDPFFRGINARQTAGGLGLGLYTAKIYTDRLDGHLNHQNESNGGSTFTLFLPDIDEQDSE